MSKKINFNKEDEKRFSDFINNHADKIAKQFGFITLNENEKDDNERSLTFLQLRIFLKVNDKHIVKTEDFTHVDSIRDSSRAFETVLWSTQKILDKFLKENQDLKSKDIKVSFYIEDVEFDFGNRISNVNSKIEFDKKIQTVKKDISR